MSAFAPPPNTQAYQHQPSEFEKLVKRKELNAQTAADLLKYISNCKVVLLCDDSGSMTNYIAEEGTDPFAPKTVTRWSELKQLAAILIEYVTALCPSGLDVHFLNRSGASGVTNISQLSALFSRAPTEYDRTPLCTSIGNIFRETRVGDGQQLLLIVLTDGCPSDGSEDDLFRLLMNKPDNYHVSFAELTDDPASMDYLDRWDGRIKFFDNCDDYREERQRVLNTQGPNFKFGRDEYMAKILLASFSRWYFNLDQTRVQQQVNAPPVFQQYAQYGQYGQAPQPMYGAYTQQLNNYPNTQNASGSGQFGPPSVQQQANAPPVFQQHAQYGQYGQAPQPMYGAYTQQLNNYPNTQNAGGSGQFGPPSAYAQPASQIGYAPPPPYGSAYNNMQ